MKAIQKCFRESTKTSKWQVTSLMQYLTRHVLVQGKKCLKYLRHYLQSFCVFCFCFNNKGDAEILLQKYLAVYSVSYANAIKAVSLGKLISLYFLSSHLSIENTG